VRIVEPAAASQDGVWTRAAWPEVDGRPGDLVALRLPLPVRAGTPYVANGWQSWSAPVVRRLGGRLERPAQPSVPAAARVSPRHLWPTPPYEGDETYDVLVADGFVAGVVDGSAVLVARPHLGDLLVVREAPAAHPDVWWSTGDAETRYADLHARAAGRVDPHRAAPTGWCSWYCYWEHVTELACRRMLHRLAPHTAGIDVFTVDDGYQSAIGDWLVTGDAFPSGLGALADRIATAGFTPGLWIAPFVASPASRLAHERPEWLLRDERSAPVVAATVDHWGGATYALDTTRDDVQAWLRDLAHTLAGLGFTHLKVDFGYAPALGGAHAQPATAERRTRAALEALRDGAGDDADLTACGTPLWPAIGVVDAMRVGPDVAPYYSPRAVPGVERAHVASLENAWRAAALRAPMHGRLWHNDPDCVLLRRRNTDLTPAQRDGWARWVAGSGQVCTLADRTEDLDDADLETWDRLVAGRAGTESVA
jgi:alpha-galactosidase